MKKLLLILALLPTLAFAQSTLSQGGTGWNTSTTGDLLVGTSSTLRYTRLPIGSTGQVLWVLGGQPAWVSTSSLGISGGSGCTTCPTYAYASSTYAILNANNVFTGKTTMTNASATSLTADTFYWTSATGTSLFSTQGSFTGLSSINATTTTFKLSGAFYDAANSAGTAGNILQTSGGGVVWAATSTLGFVPYLGANTTINVNSQTITGTGLFTSSSSLFANSTSTNFFTTNGSTTNDTIYNASTSFLTVYGTNSYQQPSLATTTVHFIGINGTPFRASIDTYNSNSIFGSQFQFRRARGTGASPTAVANGDTVGSLAFSTYSGNNFSTSSVASIAIITGGQQTNNSNPTYIGFYTTATGTVTQREVVKIQADGTLVATSSIFTNATTTNGTSTNWFATNASSTNASSTNLQVTNLTLNGNTQSFLATDLTGKVIATTTPSGSVSGGTNGFSARWTSATTLSSGVLRDNNTVAGVNATTSTSTFNIQGNASLTTARFSVASSSGSAPDFIIAPQGQVGIASTSPVYQLTVATGSIFCAEFVPNATSTAMTINPQNGCTTVIKVGVQNMVLSFSNVIAGMSWGVNTIAPPSGTPGLVFFATTSPGVTWCGRTTQPTSTQTVKTMDSWWFKATVGTSSTATAPQINGCNTPF